MPRKAKSHPICDLTKTECQYGGLQNFNYGFMHGTEDACRHPKIGTGSRNRALYTFTGRPRFPCPLGLPPANPTTNKEARG